MTWLQSLANKLILESSYVAYLTQRTRMFQKEIDELEKRISTLEIDQIIEPISVPKPKHTARRRKIVKKLNERITNANS